MHATGHGSASRFDRIFKMGVIQRGPEKGLSSNVKQEFLPDGVSAEISMPLGQQAA